MADYKTLYAGDIVPDENIRLAIQNVLADNTLDQAAKADKINSHAAYYGIDNKRIAEATGYDLATVNDYLGQKNKFDIRNYANPNPTVNQWLNQPQQPQQVQQPDNLGLGGAPSLQEYKKNPYLDDMAANITRQVTDNYQRNIAPGMRSGAMVAGGFGGSRQGVVEANALNDLNFGLSQNLTNLYGTDYNNQMNRNLQKYGMDQGYDLGLRNNDLGFANLDAGIYNSNFNNSLNAAKFGLDAFNTMQGSNNNAMNNATNVYNTPLNYSNYFTGAFNQTAGQGGSSSQTGQGNPLLGGLGGMQLGTSLGKYYKDPSAKTVY